MQWGGRFSLVRFLRLQRYINSEYLPRNTIDFMNKKLFKIFLKNYYGFKKTKFHKNLNSF